MCKREDENIKFISLNDLNLINKNLGLRSNRRELRATVHSRELRE